MILAMTATAAVDAGSIRQRAYELWERDGRPEAQEIDYWLRAEAELAGEGLSSGRVPVVEGHVPSLHPVPARQSPRSRKKVGA